MVELGIIIHLGPNTTPGLVTALHPSCDDSPIIAPNFLSPVAILSPFSRVYTSPPSFLRFDSLTPAPRFTFGPSMESPT